MCSARVIHHSSVFRPRFARVIIVIIIIIIIIIIVIIIRQHPRDEWMMTRMDG